MDETNNQCQGGEDTGSDFDADLLGAETVGECSLHTQGVGTVRLTKSQSSPCFEIGYGVGYRWDLHIVWDLECTVCY